jgi:hypothetical protein
VKGKEGKGREGKGSEVKMTAWYINYASMTVGLLNSMFNFCGRVSFIVLFCVLCFV